MAGYTLAEITGLFGGRVIGDAMTRVTGVGSLAGAGPAAITFCTGGAFRKLLPGTRAGAVILDESLAGLTGAPRIVVAHPYSYFARVSALLNPGTSRSPGVHATAQIDSAADVASSATIDAFVSIGAGARIGGGVVLGEGAVIGENAVVGPGSRLGPRVIVYSGVQIGARTLVHAGAVLGADGFGIARDNGVWLKIPQIGGLRIGDDVEIGANTTIDRGAIDDTVIGHGVKLDNQIQIGHNVEVGAGTAMAGCVAVAGSARIGARCTLGAAAVVLGHLSICDDVDVSAGTVISSSIHRPGTYTGMFPYDTNAGWRSNAALIRNLARLADRVRTLERLIRHGDIKNE